MRSHFKIALGTRVHPWQMHVDVWQNHTILKSKKKIKKKKASFKIALGMRENAMTIYGKYNVPL